MTDPPRQQLREEESGAINPYAPPADDTAEAGDDLDFQHTDRIDFEAFVEARDVTRALFRPVITFFAYSLISLVVLLSGVLLVFGDFNDRLDLRVAVGIVQFGVILIGYGVWRLFGHGVGKCRADRNPAMLGKVSGYFTRDEFVYRQAHVKGTYKLSALTELRANHHGLTLAFDMIRVKMFVIPKGAFAPGAFEEVVRRLMELRKQIRMPPRSTFDHRQCVELDEPEPVRMAISKGGIPYGGKVTYRDVAQSPLAAQTAAALYLLLIFAISGAALAAMFVSIDDYVPAALCAAGSLWLFRVGWRIRRETRPDNVMGLSRGVVLESGLFCATAIGDVMIDWGGFRSCLFGTNVNLLRMHGSLPYFMVLSRPQFASDDDWMAAIAIIQSQVKSK